MDLLVTERPTQEIFKVDIIHRRSLCVGKQSVDTTSRSSALTSLTLGCDLFFGRPHCTHRVGMQPSNCVWGCEDVRTVTYVVVLTSQLSFTIESPNMQARDK